MKAYKGFNKDMTCRGFKFKEGKKYHEDKADLCNVGFHACEDPIDCLRYYNPAESVYREVELSDATDQKEDSKRVGKTIKIGAEIDIEKICKLHFDYVKEHTTSENTDKKQASATGYYGAASATGYCGAASSTGDHGAASVGSRGGVALAVGYESKAKARIGSAICVCERGEWNGKDYPLLAIKAAIVDGTTLKPDTWYTLKNGEFVEVDNE